MPFTTPLPKKMPKTQQVQIQPVKYGLMPSGVISDAYAQAKVLHQMSHLAGRSRASTDLREYSKGNAHQDTAHKQHRSVDGECLNGCHELCSSWWDSQMRGMTVK